MRAALATPRILKGGHTSRLLIPKWFRVLVADQRPSGLSSVTTPGATAVSPCGTHHLTHLPDGKPLYASRFASVLSFHAVGCGDGRLVAAVGTDLGGKRVWFHIDVAGEPIYPQRFVRAYGFYAASLAAVCDEAGGWFHITPLGDAAYAARWSWAGNFVRVPTGAAAARCSVRDSKGRYFHIDPSGAECGGPYSYAGDFNSHGEAVVWSLAGEPSIIRIAGNDSGSDSGNAEGALPYTASASSVRWFDAAVPHKGIAAVRDAGGWFFVDGKGNELSHRAGLRFASVEPHYNGQARVRLLTGQRAVVDETGRVLLLLPKAIAEADNELTAMVTRHLWHPLALKLALEQGVLQTLNGSGGMTTDPKLRELLLLVCAEMGLCTEVPSVNEDVVAFALTSKGERLVQCDSMIADRCKYWLQDRYMRAWLPTMSSTWGGSSTPTLQVPPAPLDTFKDLARDGRAAVALSHRVLTAYAQQDWRGIADHLPLDSKQKRIVDLGGGTGSLLAEISGTLPSRDVQLLCVDRPEVVAIVSAAADEAPPSSASSPLGFVVGDLFAGPLPPADLYLLSRVLHDWDDERALVILAHIHQESDDDSTLCIIDRTASADERHASLSLHMYLLQGAHERTLSQWRQLFARGGWTATKQSAFNGHTVFTLAKEVAPATVLANAGARVNKAVIPIAGHGSRMQPQSAVTPKALLPFFSRSLRAGVVVEPAILLTLRQLLPEIKQVCIVASPVQLPVLLPFLASLHFDERRQELSYQSPPQSQHSTELRNRPQDPQLHQQLHQQRSFLDGRIEVVCQHSALGFGDAVLQAERFAGQEPFLVVLGDHLYTDGCLHQMLDLYSQLVAQGHRISECGLTGACLCSDEEVASTGLLQIQLSKATRLGDGTGGGAKAGLVVEMAEKPSLQTAIRFQQGPRRYMSQLGLDVLPPSIFADLRALQRQQQNSSDDGELNLRTAMQRLQQRGQLFACVVDGTRLDFGTPTSYLSAQLAVLQDGLPRRRVPSAPALRGAPRHFCDADGQSFLRWLHRQRQHLPPTLRAAFFGENAHQHPLAIASAPGRIDVMGGFADYSGSDVLEFPSSMRTCALVLRTAEPTLELFSMHVPSLRDVLRLPAGVTPTAPLPDSTWHKTFPASILRADAQSPVLVSQSVLRRRLVEEDTTPNWPLYVLGTLRGVCDAYPGLMATSPDASGVAILLCSDIPVNAGLASSAAVEMAVALAARSALGAGATLDDDCLSELALLCQSAENHVAGAPCGFMDQMTCAHAREGELLSLRCRLPVVSPPPSIAVPETLRLYGLTSGVRRSVADSPYERVRTAASMGRAIINRAITTDSSSGSRTPLEHLCELPLSEFDKRFRSFLPPILSGADFLAQHGPLRERDGDLATVHPQWQYPVRAATAHPIGESWRAGLFGHALAALPCLPVYCMAMPEARLRARYTQLGELMKQSHQGYSECGLGCVETDILTALVHAEHQHDLIGAKITGGGSGGTVAVLARSTDVGHAAVQRVQEQYSRQTGRPCLIVAGSSGRVQLHAFTQRRLSSVSVARAALVRQPRVLLVTHGYPPEFNGGSEVYTQTLGIQLLRSSACTSVDVLAREHDAFRADFLVRSRPDVVEPRLTVHLLNHAREAPYARFASEPIDEQFREVLRQLRPDVVHFGHLNHLSLHLPLVAQQEGAKTVYTLHDFWLMCPRGQFLVTGVTSPDGEPWQMCDGQEDRKCAQRCYVGRFATGLTSTPHASKELAYWSDWVGDRMTTVRDMVLPAIDAFVAPSVHLMRRFLHNFPTLPEDKLVLLPYGYDRQRLIGRRRRQVSAAGAPGESQHPVVFAYIGRHQASKGLHLLVEAASQLVQQQPSMAGRFRVFIYGRADASTTPSLRRMVQESSALAACSPAVVEFRPEYANTSIVSSVFDEVDAIVVPSIWDENSPLVIHEAQQCRLPVITSAHGGMGELVRHGINGLTFRHRDATSLADALRTAVEQPEYLHALGLCGYLHSADGQVPTVERHAAEIVALYQRLLQGLPVKAEGSSIRGGSDGGASVGEYDGLLRPASSTGSSSSPSRPQEPKPITPLAAPWRITFDTNPDDCNFSCTMCEQHSEYSPHQIARKKQGIRRRRMDFEMIRTVVEQMAPLGLKEIIPTTMGEPLMYKHFPSIVELCHKHNVKLNLTTNGSFFPLPGGPTSVEDWAMLLVPVTVDVKLSWNGATEETQQKIMKRSSLAQQLSNLARFIRVRDELAATAAAAASPGETPHRCNVTLQLTFMEDNLNEIPDIVRLAIAHGCDRVKGHHLWAHFAEIKAQDLRRCTDSIARWNAVAAQCRALARTSAPHPGSGMRIRLDNFYDLPTGAVAAGSTDASAGSSVHPAAVCPFLGREAWVNHAGRFDPCCAPDMQRQLFLGSFGNIADAGNDMMAVWSSEKYQRLIANYRANPLCKGCSMRRPPE